MNEFRIPLRNDKLPQYRQLTQLVFVINWIVFVYLGISTKDAGMQITLIAAAAILGLLVIADFFLQKKNDSEGTIFPYLIFAGIIAAWLKAGFWQPAAVMGAIFLIHVIAVRPLIVFVNTQSVRYPSFPVRHIAWDELGHVMLKDGLLTIDLLSNKIYQPMTDADKISFREADFNEFCRRQLESKQRA